MSNIKLSPVQINILLETFQEKKPDKPGKIEKGLTVQNIYKADTLKLEEIKVLVSEETQLIKKLKKTVYGSNLLIFSALNPDFRVFEYVYGLYETNAIKIDKMNLVKGVRKKKIENKDFYLLENESLMSIAYKLKNEQLLKFLQSKGLSDISIPKIPEHLRTHYDNDSFKQDSDFLQYSIFCAFMNTQNQSVEKSLFTQEINRYASVALAQKSLQEYVKEYTGNVSFGEKIDKDELGLPIAIFYMLGFTEDIFKNEFYRKEIFPLALRYSFLAQDNIPYYSLQSYKYLFEDSSYEILFKNFTKEASQKEVSELKTIIKRSKIEKTSKLLEMYKVYEEKSQLQNLIVKDKKDKKVNKL